MKPALCKFIRIWGVVRPELNLGPGSGYSIWELSRGLVCGGGGYSERRNFLFRSGDVWRMRLHARSKTGFVLAKSAGGQKVPNKKLIKVNLE